MNKIVKFVVLPLAGVAKAVVEGKKEEIKAKAQEQLQNKLKGLFGR